MSCDHEDHDVIYVLSPPHFPSPSALFFLTFFFSLNFFFILLPITHLILASTQISRGCVIGLVEVHGRVSHQRASSRGGNGWLVCAPCTKKPDVIMINNKYARGPRDSGGDVIVASSARGSVVENSAKMARKKAEIERRREKDRMKSKEA